MNMNIVEAILGKPRAIQKENNNYDWQKFEKWESSRLTFSELIAASELHSIFKEKQ